MTVKPYHRAKAIRIFFVLSAWDSQHTHQNALRPTARFIHLGAKAWPPTAEEMIKIAETHCGLTIQHCNKLMRVYREFGQNTHACVFSVRTLIELSRADDPQAALEEANEIGGTLTVKQAKEIRELSGEEC